MTREDSPDLTRIAQRCLQAAMLLLLIGVTSNCRLFAQAQPPQQPASGPGGAEGNYRVRESTFGTGGKQYWLYEPDPSRGSAPVIVFLHGWGAMQPGGYRLWIDHLVQRGNIVIYPRYQETLKEPPPNMTPLALDAIRDAFSRLGNRADRSKFAVVGHSVGGIVSFNVAAMAGAAGLPTPRAVMAVEPADTDINPLLRGRVKLIREADRYSQIPSNILALVVVGAEDRVAGEKGARLEFAGLRQVPCQNKNFVVVRSDRHGDPPLNANHFAPAAAAPSEEPESSVRGGRGIRRGGGLFARRRANQVEESLDREPTGMADALDYYGFWKLLDGLTDAAFYNRNREYALGGGSKMTSMGNWSDGRPVQPLLVSNDPSCRR